jgi:hypothetical protein
LIANLKFLEAVVRVETRAVLLPVEFVGDFVTRLLNVVELAR